MGDIACIDDIRGEATKGAVTGGVLTRHASHALVERRHDRGRVGFAVCILDVCLRRCEEVPTY
jgi:hypothetical protein